MSSLITGFLAHGRNLHLAVVLWTLLVLAFGTGFAWNSWNTEYARQLRDLASLAEFGEKSMDAYFLNLGRALALLGENLRHTDGSIDIERAETRLKRFRATYSELRIAHIAAPDGRVLASSSAIRTKRNVGRDDPSFFEASSAPTAGRIANIGRPFVGSVTGKWSVAIRHAVRDAQGRIHFIAAAGLPISVPENFWRDAPLPPGTVIGLIRDDGYFVSRFPSPDAVVQKQLFTKPIAGPFFQHLSASRFPKEGWIEAKNSITGAKALFVFRRLAQFPITLVINMPKSNVWSVWWVSTRFAFLLLALLVVGSLAIYRWTRERRAEWDAERESRIAKLEAANRELESFTYTMSHDLRSPVRAIDGYAAIVLEDCAPQLPATGRTKLEQIRGNARRMDRLIDGLLAFTRYFHQPLEIRHVDVHALVASLVAETNRAAGDCGIRIADLPACDADPTLLTQVWTNLLDNALKFSREAQPSVIEIGYSDGAYYVRDNGVGFDMSHAKDLFSVFSRLHPWEAFEGTGVGLAIARRIVERHRGRIWAQSRPGAGATFYFTVGAAV